MDAWTTITVSVILFVALVVFPAGVLWEELSPAQRARVRAWLRR